MRHIVFLLGIAGSCLGATWTGTISDSSCGASHAKMIAERPDMKDNRECALQCVNGGSEFVFVSGGRIFKLANQSNPDFKAHAGHVVEITGEMHGDTITVSKIEMKKKP